MRWLWTLNERSWRLRLPIKGLILALTTFIVCFPYPNLFWRHISRWRDPGRLIDPNSPALAPWVDQVRTTLPQNPSDREIVEAVEAFVYQHVAYAWDWDNWGVADYIPTVSEVVERRKEDCDGRAVVAASLMCRLGVPARLVTDFGHLWVTTNVRDAMGPGIRPAVISTDQGVDVHWDALPNLARALGFGVAVFPWTRETVVLTVLWILLLHRGCGFGRAVLSGVGFAIGLWVMRAGGRDYWAPSPWQQPMGAALLLGSIVALQLGSLRARRSHAEGAATGERPIADSSEPGAAAAPEPYVGPCKDLS